MSHKWLVILISTLLVSCSQSLEQYRDNTPALKLEQFFNGSLVAHGIIQDYSGQVVRSFRAELTGQWQDNQGVLDEKFYFNDGEVQYRCWHLLKSGNSYIGKANDVEGEAKGEVSGNTLNWKYYLNLDTDAGVRTLYVDDWLYLIDENTLLNKTDMSFYGIDVAELTLSISKQPTLSFERNKNCKLKR